MKVQDANEGDAEAPDQKDAIIPRWEWRMFGRDLAEITNRMAGADHGSSHHSLETYILYLNGSQNAKIRDNQLDIKTLQNVDSDGLELWRPVFKATFPLSPQQVSAAFGIWGLEPPPLSASAYGRDEFLHEAIGQRRPFQIVDVEKDRRGFVYKCCIAEFARLTSGSESLQSISFEHQNPAVVLDALRSLGLETERNTSYPSALKALFCVGAI